MRLFGSRYGRLFVFAVAIFAAALLLSAGLLTSEADIKVSN
jgi:hypothetical protein